MFANRRTDLNFLSLNSNKLQWFKAIHKLRNAKNDIFQTPSPCHAGVTKLCTAPPLGCYVTQSLNENERRKLTFLIKIQRQVFIERV